MATETPLEQQVREYLNNRQEIAALTTKIAILGKRNRELRKIPRVGNVLGEIRRKVSGEEGKDGKPLLDKKSNPQPPKARKVPAPSSLSSLATSSGKKSRLRLKKAMASNLEKNLEGTGQRISSYKDKAAGLSTQ
jgi:hypothetical protein